MSKTFSFRNLSKLALCAISVGVLTMTTGCSSLADKQIKRVGMVVGVKPDQIAE
jgi:hypothetical protein